MFRYIRIIVVLLLITSIVLFVRYKYASTPLCKDCNVMLISLDQVRAKSLPCFGYRQNTMPGLCAFAKKSYVYTNAYATASRTHDSHFSMMTSLYPETHTMNLPYSSILPEGIPTLAESLKGLGYQTYYFGVTKDPHLPLDRGMERGFTSIYEADDPGSWVATLDALAQEPGKLRKKSFFFMHTYMAHEPYMPDDETLSRFYNGAEKKRMTYDDLCALTYAKLMSLRPELASGRRNDTRNTCDKLAEFQGMSNKTYDDYNDVYTIINDEYWKQFDYLSKEDKSEYIHALYSAQLYNLDQELTKFFAYLTEKNFIENTVVIIVGDQGDEFFEHDSYSHGNTLYNEVLHVPFMVYIPKSRAERSGRLVSLVDIFPTIYDVLGSRMTVPVSGISVFSPARHMAVLAEHVSDGAVAVITNRFKLIRSIVGGKATDMLYDLRRDPAEKINLVEKHGGVVSALLRVYRVLQRGFPDIAPRSDPLPSWINDQDRKTLIESGYF